MDNTREKLVELMMDMPFGRSTYEENERHFGDLADYLIANGVTFATDNNVGDKMQKFLIKSDPISVDNMRELLDGPAIFCTGTDSIVPIHPYQWIPVTERLPEQYETVIGWTGNTMGEVELYHGDEFVWVDDNGWNNIAPVTHWMPLPEPPKGE